MADPNKQAKEPGLAKPLHHTGCFLLFFSKRKWTKLHIACETMNLAS
jgi:hypothetical protein